MKQINNVLSLCYSKPLLISSVCMCIGHFPYIIVSIHPVKYYYILGLVTSVINHSYSEHDYLKIYFRILDRIVIILGVLINFYIIDNFQDLYILSTGVFCYFFSKLTKWKIFHIFSHCCAITLNNNILSY
jgi:hypothetical protein